MPNAILENLLRLKANQTQIPMYNEDEEAFGPTDEELYDAQDEIGARGAARGTPYFVPSRDELKQSGMQAVRRMLGLRDLALREKVLPAQVEAQGRIGAARIAAETAASRDADRQAFTAEQNALNRTAVGERMAANREATTARSQAKDKAVDARQARTQKNARLTQLQSGKLHMPAEGNFLTRLLGLAPSQAEVDQREIDRLQSEESIADQIMQDHPNATFEDLVSSGVVSADTPEELQAFHEQWVAAGGR